MRFDFNVLTFDADEEVDSGRLLDEYISGGYDGIYLRIPKGMRLRNLTFLLGLDALRYLEVKGAVSDDSDSFRISGLVELVLLTRCKKPVPRIGESRLDALHVDDRPGIDRLAGTALRSLTVWGFRASDLMCLSGFSSLRRLKIEGRGQDLDPVGLEACRSLVDIEFLEMRLTRLEAFRELHQVSRLWLIGKAAFTPQEPLAVENLEALKLLNEIRITWQGSITSVLPLLSLPLLRDLRLGGTRIEDGNVDALAKLAERANVLGPDE